MIDYRPHITAIVEANIKNQTCYEPDGTEFERYIIEPFLFPILTEQEVAEWHSNKLPMDDMKKVQIELLYCDAFLPTPIEEIRKILINHIMEKYIDGQLNKLHPCIMAKDYRERI